MNTIILIPQSNTSTQTMIYPIRTFLVRCDRCEAELETNAASLEAVRETAERNGWLITDKGDWLKERHYCPKCKEEIYDRKND